MHQRSSVSISEVLSRLQGRNIRLLEYGGGTGKVSTFQCTLNGCGYVWDKLTSTVLAGCGCPKSKTDHGLPPMRLKRSKAVGVKRSETVSKIDAECRLNDKHVSILEYSGAVTKPSLLVCKRDGCGHTWMQSADRVKENSCAACRRRQSEHRLKVKQQKVRLRPALVTLPLALTRLEGRGIDIVAYNGYSRSKSSLICTKDGCGHEWIATLQNIFNGSGCPKCAKHGFNPGKLASIYLYRILNKGVEYLGFGITNNMQARGRNHSKTFETAGARAELLFERSVPGTVARAAESRLKKELDCVSSGLKGFTSEALPYSDRDLKRVSTFLNSVDLLNVLTLRL